MADSGDNKRKQRFLNANGIKVPIDGSWGPWQQKQYEKIKAENVAKQKFLNLNGVMVKMDGSWGPWQEQQYQRLTTKDKYYQTTPLGLLSYLYDKTLGSGTTYKVDPLSPYYNGEIREDDRSATRRYLDQQMKDNKTPLGYLTQTVLPAAAVSSAIVYGGPGLKGIGAAVLNPITRRYAVESLVREGAKGFAGATAVNLASKATTGKTWGEQVAQSTGVSPEFGEFTNVGVYAPTYLKNVTKRAVETAMRTTASEKPIEEIVNGAEHIVTHDPKRAGAIGTYILTGKRFGNKGYYNSFAPNYTRHYDGFFGAKTEGQGNDLIDAFLYKKPISPEYGVKKLDTKDYGVHTDYVKKHYPDKDIQIYETQPPADLTTYPEKDISAAPTILGVSSSNKQRIFETSTRTGPNVAGYLVEHSRSLNEDPIYRGQDIWKFNPDDYIKRWGLDDRSIALEKLSKFGLKLVDHLGTPVIIRTPWMPSMNTQSGPRTRTSTHTSTHTSTRTRTRRTLR